MAVVSATRSLESCALNAPVSRVFEMFRDMTFKYNPNIEVEESKSEVGVGSIRKLKYKDGTVQSVKILGISDLDFKVSWTIVTSEPAVSYSSAVHQVQCFRITTKLSESGPQTYL